MEEVMFVLGVVCVIAAVVGGGLTAAGTQVPVISSLARQLLLAIIGLFLVWLFAPEPLHIWFEEQGIPGPSRDSGWADPD
jgi:hypothetical protein